MQRFHGDEEDAFVDGVHLSEDSLAMITDLFKVRRTIARVCVCVCVHVIYSSSPLKLIDRNSDGKLDILDFSLDGTYATTHFQKWQELRHQFDLNGDGQVTVDEVNHTHFLAPPY